MTNNITYQKTIVFIINKTLILTNQLSLNLLGNKTILKKVLNKTKLVVFNKNHICANKL